jgi:hypothetical protein
MSPTRAPPGRVALVNALAVLFVANLTLWPTSVETLASPAPFLCLLGCGEETVRDVLSNILLFIPLGWAFSHWMKRRTVVLTCLAVTIVIETLQATAIPGRDPSLRDIVSDLAGGAVGTWLFAQWRVLVWPRPRMSLGLGGAAAAFWLLVLAVTGLGNRLVSSGAVWFGFWAPELAYYQQYRGQLLSVRQDGWIPANGRITASGPLREAIQRDSFRLTVQVISGPKPSGPSLIFAIIDGDRRSQVLLGQERSAIWLRWRNRFEAWDLRGTTLRIPISPGISPGSPVTIETGRDHRNLVLRASSGGESAEVRVPQTVGLGWTSMLPFNLAISTEWKVFNPIWLAGLILPLAYWFARGVGPAGLVSIVLIALGLGLGLMPMLTGAAATTPPEWIGSSLGAALGAMTGYRSRRSSGLTKGAATRDARLAG